MIDREDMMPKIKLQMLLPTLSLLIGLLFTGVACQSNDPNSVTSASENSASYGEPSVQSVEPTSELVNSPPAILTQVVSATTESASNVESDFEKINNLTETVQFESNLGNAAVYIDDVFVGTTPLEILLTVGMHHVRAELPGFSPWKKQIDITSTVSIVEIEFSFQPSAQQMVTECVEIFWWADDSQSFYYILCDDMQKYTTEVTGDTTGRLKADAAIYQVDIHTGETSVVTDEDVWPDAWIPKKFWSQLPDDDVDWTSQFVLAPSRESLVYIYRIPKEPQVEFSRTSFFYAVVLSDHHPPIEFGPIEVTAVANISWSANGTRIFLRRNRTGAFDGYLIDLQQMEMTTWQVPEFEGMEDYEAFAGAQLLPHGEGIIFNPSDPLLPKKIMLFENQTVIDLSHLVGGLYWLDSSRYAIIEGECPNRRCNDDWYWFDYEEDVLVRIISEQDAGFQPGILRGRVPFFVSPDSRRLLSSEREPNGGYGNGVWMIEFDNE